MRIVKYVSIDLDRNEWVEVFDKYTRRLADCEEICVDWEEIQEWIDNNEHDKIRELIDELLPYAHIPIVCYDLICLQDTLEQAGKQDLANLIQFSGI